VTPSLARDKKHDNPTLKRGDSPIRILPLPSSFESDHPMSPGLSNGSPLVNGALHSNSTADIGWIVQKFGGTSVGKFAEKIAEDVVGYCPSGSDLN
jgi:hypothetical protein